MTRRKVTLAYITNDSERKATFRKRKKGLINKVRELSTLCDVQACAVIYSPYENEPEVWPSRAGAQAVVARFKALSEMDRTRKMVNQESFTRQRIKKTEDKLRRLHKENRRREMEGFMFQCLSGLVGLIQLDPSNWAEMGWVIDQTMRDITSRMEVMKINGQDGSAPEPVERVAVQPLPPPPPAGPGNGEMDGYLLNPVQSAPYPFVFGDFSGDFYVN